MATFTSVHGAVVEIGGDGLQIEQKGPTMLGYWQSEQDLREFVVTARRFGEGDGGAVEEGVRLTEEYTLLSGARMRTGTRTVTDPVTKLVVRSVLGVWLGSAFAVHSWISRDEFENGEAAMTAEMLRVFNQFSFTETSTGVVISPLDVKRFTLVRDGPHAPSVLRYVDEIGLIETFQRTPEQEWRIPKEAGAPVAGGELWVAARGPGEPGDRDQQPLLVFLLVSDTAYSHINTDVGAVSEKTLIDRCGRLTIGWKAG